MLDAVVPIDLLFDQSPEMRKGHQRVGHLTFAEWGEVPGNCGHSGKSGQDCHRLAIDIYYFSAVWCRFCKRLIT